jgi:lysozyme
MSAAAKRSNQSIRKPLLIITVAFIVFSAAILTITYKAEVRYFLMGAFEEPVDLRKDYSIHGIDVSRYQGNINWNGVGSYRSNGKQIKFAFIKASEGATRKDPYFKRNWRKAKEVNLIRGAYHYYLPYIPPTQQASNFIEQVSLKSNDLPPVVDLEEFNGENVVEFRKNVKLFLEKITNHYGMRPVLYTNPLFYENYLRNHFDDYPLWVAHYRTHYKPRISRDWHFWQYTEKGRIKGISYFVDINVFNGEMEDLKKLLVP